MKKNKKEVGQGLVEYALILVLVAIVVIAALMILGPMIDKVFVGELNRDILKSVPVNTPTRLYNVIGGNPILIDYDDYDCVPINIGSGNAIKIGTLYEDPGVISISRDGSVVTICNNAPGTILKVYWTAVESPR